MDTPPGKFITFEGCDGAGKSTQAARLAAALRGAGHNVVETREPGGSPRAEAIRELLLSGDASKFGAFAEAMLFNAARADHLRATIRPALARGATVICDRFADSTRAYQGALGEVSDDIVRAAEAAVVGDTKPDLTVILDLPAEITLQRVSGRGSTLGTPDRFEAGALAHHGRLRQAYLDIAAQSPERCVVISARGSIDGIAHDILGVVERRFGHDKPTLAVPRSFEIGNVRDQGSG
jgi:dTMP kinase